MSFIWDNLLTVRRSAKYRLSKINCVWFFVLLIWVSVPGLMVFAWYDGQRLLCQCGGRKSTREVEYEPAKSGAQLNLGNAVTATFDQLMTSPLTLEQDDPRLIQRLISKFLLPPSDKPYNLSSKNEDPSMGQAGHVRAILSDKRGGFFVECGGLDGETRSNSLVFEKTLGWKGVLIEGDPKNFQLLKGKNRKAWAVNGCLSIYPYPSKLMFKQAFNVGRVKPFEKSTEAQEGYVAVQCFPLYSILLALNTTTVDFFSLDVEGDELKVLKTIPWEKVDIKILSVEMIHTDEGTAALKRYVVSKGYKFYQTVTNDFIFIKDDGKTEV